jgi:Zn-finger nucleic acid-binding protein
MALVEREATQAGVKVDLCPSCNGAWFDAGELESATSVAVKHVAPPSDAKPSGRLCARCGEPMVSFTYPQTLVTVDMCRKCRGLWLDGGELREIVTVREALRKSGQLQQEMAPGGIKGSLIHLIDESIDDLKFW